MSIRLRVKYRFRSLKNFFSAWSIPGWLNSWAARSLLAGLLIFAGGLYIFQINAISTRGYQIHTLEQEVAGLGEDVQKLASEAASYQSMASIQKRLSSLQMLPAGSVSYFKASREAEVAKR